MNSITIAAPAKVNIFLKILNRRKDGYHNIFTLFERVSLSDTITIKKRPSGIKVTSNVTITGKPEDNLAYKAAFAILRHENIDSGVSIHINKRIPIAAGLGGGSSDAASTLLAVNKLYRLGLKKEALMKIGRKLGADVPFFILEKPFAYAKGAGDRLEIVPQRKRFWHIIINPGFKVATKDIYQALDKARARRLTKKAPNATINRPVRGPLQADVLEPMMHNDLEEIVISKRVVIGTILRRLANLLGTKVIVSGSGPSVFCLYETRKEAEKAKELIFSSIPGRERKGWHLVIAKTLV